MGRSRSLYLVAILFLTLAAFAVRAVSLEAQSLWRDEVDAMRFAMAPLDEVLSKFARNGWNGPLYFLLLRGWIGLTGTSEYAMRFFSLFFGVLCVPLIYVLGRRLFDRRTGLIAALLVTASPYLTWYGQEVKMYTLVPALALLAIYALRRATEGGRWGWWAVQAVATSIAFYSHILAAILVPVQIIIWFVWWPQARKHWRGAVISGLCLTLPYLPLALWQVPMLVRARETGFTRFSLGETVQILVDHWSIGARGTYGGGWPWGSAFMGLLAAWGILSPLVALLRHERLTLRSTSVLLFWMVFPPLAVWCVSLWQPLFTDRYFVWCALSFYLLIAAGLTVVLRLGKGGRWIVMILVGVVISLNGLNQWQQATTSGKADYRGAVAYLASNYPAPAGSLGTAPPSTVECQKCTTGVYVPLFLSGHPMEPLIVFQIPYARYSFDYYFPHEDYEWADGLYTNHRYTDDSYMMTEENAALAMQRLTAERDVVWLFATEMWLWDDRGLVKAWLDANMRLVDEKESQWVAVYRYER
jgi:mannosyltransferase